MNEAGFTRYIFKKLPPEIYKLKLLLPLQTGVPDAYFSGNKGDCWIEFKYITAPKKFTTNIVPNLSELQLQWLLRRKKEGRTVAVVLGSDIGCHIYSNVDWISPINRNILKLQQRKDVIDWIIAKTLA
jgi:hypothetical protein